MQGFAINGKILMGHIFIFGIIAAKVRGVINTL